MVSIDQLGAELGRQRNKKGMSLRDVEGKTGISAATLSRVERGSMPELGVVEKLAAWLDVTVCAAGGPGTAIATDEDLKRTIAVHLRANKNLPEAVARAIIDGFDLIMQMEMQKAGIRGKGRR
jgi:transcriptional regulator with XRE-family HTH domain